MKRDLFITYFLLALFVAVVVLAFMHLEVGPNSTVDPQDICPVQSPC